MQQRDREVGKMAGKNGSDSPVALTEEDIKASNKAMLHHGVKRDPQMFPQFGMQNIEYDGSTSMDIIYNHTSGMVPRTMQDLVPIEDHSIVNWKYNHKYPAGNIPDVGRNSDGSIHVRRFSQTDVPFGEMPGDRILEESVNSFFAEREDAALQRKDDPDFMQIPL